MCEKSGGVVAIHPLNSMCGGQSEMQGAMMEVSLRLAKIGLLMIDVNNVAYLTQYLTKQAVTDSGNNDIHWHDSFESKTHKLADTSMSAAKDIANSVRSLQNHSGKWDSTSADQMQSMFIEAQCLLGSIESALNAIEEVKDLSMGLRDEMSGLDVSEA